MIEINMMSESPFETLSASFFPNFEYSEEHVCYNVYRVSSLLPKTHHAVFREIYR